MYKPHNDFLPKELHDTVWTDLEDPSALEAGDWVFDKAPHAHYAGQVIELGNAGLIKVNWRKSIDNTFDSWETYNKLRKMVWLDPCVEIEED